MNTPGMKKAMRNAALLAWSRWCSNVGIFILVKWAPPVNLSAPCEGAPKGPRHRKAILGLAAMLGGECFVFGFALWCPSTRWVWPADRPERHGSGGGILRLRRPGGRHAHGERAVHLEL